MCTTPTTYRHCDFAVVPRLPRLLFILCLSPSSSAKAERDGNMLSLDSAAGRVKLRHAADEVVGRTAPGLELLRR